MVKYTRAKNLKELNKDSAYIVSYTGYFAHSDIYPHNKVRQYRFTIYGNNDVFEIVFNSDREDFISVDEFKLGKREV